jgi:methionine-rich copper-binding protein CopC
VFTVNPNVDFALGELCALTVFAAQVTDQDALDPPDAMAANHVASFTTETAPSITATTPAAASVAATTANLSLTFSEPVNVTGNWFQIVCTTSGTRNVAATAVSGGPSTFTVNPTVDFTAGESCTVTVFAAQVADQDAVDPPDTMAANHVFTFTVDAAPTVTATSPTNGALHGLSADVTVTFSEPVAITGSWFTIVCTVSGTRNTSNTVVTGGPTTFTLNPATDFSGGDSCTFTVLAAQVSDVDAIDPPDVMAANHVITFTIDAAPTVTSTTPTNGAVGVSPATTIAITFSESVSATTASFTIECPASSARAFTLSASPATTFTLTPTVALPEGIVCTVTVTAAQVSDADTADPPDHLAANHVFSFSIPPNAVNDSRSVTGNVSINTAGSGFSVLANDVGPALMVTAFDAASARGGVVTLSGATGTFTYNPPVGYEGTDSFTYTISNSAGSDTATVTLTVAGMLWFINGSASACTTIAAGCGRLSTPFSTLAAFNAVDGGATTNGSDVVDPEAGDHVFLYTGTYAGGLTPESSQRIIGQGASTTLATLSGITPATDSATLPTTGGTKPTINTAGITLAQNNQLHGLAFSGTSGAAIASSGSVGTLVLSDIVITNTTTSGITLIGGGTVTATGVNDITTTTGTALTVSNTTIGAANLTFHSISANGAASGIILTTTGASGGLIVTGSGSSTVGGDNSGGTIQNTTGSGIVLTSTQSPSFTNVRVVNTNGSGVRGTTVTNFTFRNGTIDQSDNDGTGAVDESNIAFNVTTAGTENNLSGTVTITNNTLTNALYHGVDIFNFAGTLASVTISGNTITSGTTTGPGGTSFGSGIRLVAFGSATTVASVTNAVIANNIITNFPGGAGITVQGGNGNAAGAAGTMGLAGNGSAIVAITGNRIAGQSGGAGQGMGTYAIQASVSGKGQGNFNVSGNGTVMNPITNIEGNVISLSALGIAAVTSTITNNVIDANHQADFGGPLGISVGAGEVNGIGDTASLTTTISGNTITDTDGNGILAAVREGSSTLVARILNNSVAAPLGGIRPGIRVDSGLNTATNNTVCLEISGNTSAGSSDSGITAPGIGFRKEGTVATTHTFGIEGLSPSPTGTPTVENFVNGNNPGSASGVSFGVGGTALISATSGFTSCTAP